jgi:hypothetical protein
MRRWKDVCMFILKYEFYLYDINKQLNKQM